MIIKLGGNGCYTVTEKEKLYTKALPVKVVDTTGAGDNFVGGIIHAVAMGYDLAGCVEYANAAEAIVVTKIGTMAALKDHHKVIDFLAQHRSRKKET